MARRTVIVEPYELCIFAEKKYGIDNRIASNMTRWVTPECEVKTYDYDLEELKQELIDEPDDDGDYPDFPVSPRQMLIDYMTDLKFKSFTLTQ